MKKQILKNLISNYLASFIAMALGFLVIPFLIRKLGKEAFGVIVLAEALIAFSQVFTVSVRIALSRYATFSLSQGKTDEFAEYLSTGRVLLFFSTALVLALGFFVSFYFPSFFRVPAGFAWQSRILFALVTLAFAISIPNIVFWSVLYAKERFDLINFSSSVGVILRALCIFIFFSALSAAYANLVAYGFIYLAMTWGQNLMVYFFQRKIMPGLKITLKRFRPEKIKEILSYTGHTSLGNLSGILCEDAINIGINLFLGPAFNAVYSVALKFPTMMRRLFEEPSWALTPTFTVMAAKNEKKKIETLFFMYSKAMTILATPLAMVLIIFSKRIILAWVGNEFLLAAEIMAVYASATFLMIPFSVCGCITNAYGKVKIPSRVNLAVGLGHIVLSAFLVLRFKLGLLGIAASSLVFAVLSSAFFSPFYSCRVSEMSFWRYWRESFLKPFLLGVFLIVIDFLAVKTLFLETKWMAVPSVVFVSACFYYVVAYRFCLNFEERRHVGDIVSSFVIARKKISAEIL